MSDQKDPAEYGHDSVFECELVENATKHLSADEIASGIAIDCTCGGGGHTALLLKMNFAKVISLDRDPEAISFLKKRFQKEIVDEKLILLETSFSKIYDAFTNLSLDFPVVSIIADLGVSSPQLDKAERGFSFMREGPLDMRMSPDVASAADRLHQASLEEITEVLRKYGEEPQAYKIAQAIVAFCENEKFSTTLQLADLISKTVHYKTKSRKHPATKSFQAIRIWVNDELAEVEKMLESGFSLLVKKGRMSIITFHSLEDRIVKHFFKKHANLPPSPRGLPIIETRTPPGSIIKPFPVKPSQEEERKNRRARSAKLRTIQKVSL